MLCRNIQELRELVCKSRLDYCSSDSVIDDAPQTSSHRQSEQPGDWHLTAGDEFETASSSCNSDMLSGALHDNSTPDRDVSVSETGSVRAGRGNVKSSKNNDQFQTVLPPLSRSVTDIKRILPLVESAPHSQSQSLLPTYPSSGDLSAVFDAVDFTVITEWLEETNNAVSQLTDWCTAGNNFVAFAHFWLSYFAGADQTALIRMEYGIFLDRLATAFLPSCKVRSCHIHALAAAVLHEYPRKLLSSMGRRLILDYIHVLTTKRRDLKFRRILSDIHCSTLSRGHTEIVLALRAFALASILSAFVEFFRQLTTQTNVCHVDAVESMSRVSDECLSAHRMSVAIKNGYVDVVHFLIKSGQILADYIDVHQRSLVYLAVQYKQPTILSFLLTHVACRDIVDVNRCADNGNTPLHVAVNLGEASLVELLMSARDIDVNAQNMQTDGTTALHLAVMHGNEEIVCRLMRAGANPSLTTGGLTAVDLAPHCDINV